MVSIGDHPGGIPWRLRELGRAAVFDDARLDPGGFKITFGCNAFALFKESERLAFGITDNLIRVSVIQSWLKRDGYETTEVSCNYAMMVAPTLSVRQLF